MDEKVVCVVMIKVVFAVSLSVQGMVGVIVVGFDVWFVHLLWK